MPYETLKVVSDEKPYIIIDESECGHMTNNLGIKKSFNFAQNIHESSLITPKI